MSEKDQVWLCLPHINSDISSKHLPAWKDQGYKIAVLQDRHRFDAPYADIVAQPWNTYAGYAASCNFLMRHVVPKDVRLMVIAGEDMLPDSHHKANQILELFASRFPDFMGVMQPTGDQFTGTDKICGSPFIGRTFEQEWNHGIGPKFPGYNHYFNDEELLVVSSKYDLCWQNPELTHYHSHWSRGGKKPEHHAPLEKQWDHDKATFLFRQSKNFPGHEPLSKVIKRVVML